MKFCSILKFYSFKKVLSAVPVETTPTLNISKLAKPASGQVRSKCP